MEISIANLSSIFENVHSIFGRSVKQGYVQIMAAEQTEVAIEEITDQIHPISRLLYDLSKDTERSVKSNKLEFSSTSLKLLDLYEQISTLREIHGFERILVQLDNKRQFASTCYEILVASYYVKSGWDLEIIAEREEMSSDFRVQRGEQVLILECKSLEDKQVAAERAWNRFSRDVNSIGKRLGWQLMIKIVAHDYIDNDCVHRLIRYLNQNIEPNRTFSLRYESYEIEIQWLTHFDSSYPVSEIRVNMGNFGRLEFSCMQRNGEMWISGLTAVQVQTYFSRKFENSASKHFKKAKKQLRQERTVGEGSTVLYVEVPHDNAEGFAHIYSSLYKEFAPRIQIPSTEVNAIILSTLSDKFHADKDGNISRFSDHLVIPSFNNPVKDDLHKELLILGAAGAGNAEEVLESMKRHPTEGTIGFELFLESKLVTEVGSYIFKAVSPFGDYQVKISVVKENVLNFEIINPVVSRLTTVVNVEGVLKIQSMNKIFFTFTENELRVAINGTILNEIAKPKH